MCEHVLFSGRAPVCLVAYGTVNTVLGFAQTTSVINGFWNLVMELYRP